MSAESENMSSKEKKVTSVYDKNIVKGLTRHV